MMFYHKLSLHYWLNHHLDLDSMTGKTNVGNMFCKSNEFWMFKVCMAESPSGTATYTIDDITDGFKIGCLNGLPEKGIRRGRATDAL